VDSWAASPTAKSLRTLELLQTRPGITGAELASRLGVSDRAARRHIAALRDAGVPVESTSGPYGGYRLGRAVRLPPLVFTASEALGLVMAVLDGHHAAADPDDPVGAALGKLLRSLPQQVAGQAASMREHALSAPDRRAARPDPAFTSALVDAVAGQRAVRLGYRSESGREWQTDADPWAIVVRHGRWYLVCLVHHVGAPRALRIDRIQQLDVLNVTIDVPADLDPVAWLEQHLSTGWEFDTHVVFHAPVDEVARHVRPPMGRLEAVDDTRCRLTGTTSNPAMYAGEWLAAIPLPFTVTGGPELRDAVAEIGRRMTAAAEALLPGHTPMRGTGHSGERQRPAR
jgi:predicted DNA-binding transcriptional regulator YafY